MAGVYDKTGHLCFSCDCLDYFDIRVESLLLAIWRLVCLWLCLRLYQHNDLPFETYLKYRFHYELTVPDRTLTGQKGNNHEKLKSLNETQDLF